MSELEQYKGGIYLLTTLRGEVLEKHTIVGLSRNDRFYCVSYETQSGTRTEPLRNFVADNAMINGHNNFIELVNQRQRRKCLLTTPTRAV